MIKHVYLSVAFVLFYSAVAAQEKDQSSKEKFTSKHSLGINIGHEHAFTGRSENGDKQVLILPYWGIDYNFQFAQEFSVGLHTDFVVESFEVEKNLESGSEKVIKRTRPVAPALMGFFKPTEHWSFGIGIGGEFAKEENYVLNRLAVEYAAEIRKNWEVFGALQYDFRWNAYDTWTIGLGISKAFGKSKK